MRNREARPLAGNIKPTYPAAALRNGVQGSVIASLNVDTRGQVTRAAIVSRTGERSRDLDRAVLSAVQNWKFQPAMHGPCSGWCGAGPGGFPYRAALIADEGS